MTVPFQFSNADDKALEALDPIMKKAKEDIASAQKIYDDAFAKALVIFDGYGKPGMAHKFITSSGKSIARQVTKPDERIDSTLLETALATTLGEEAAGKLWRRVTDPQPRLLSQTKVVKLINNGSLDPVIVAKAMITPTGTASRHYRKASKEDIAQQETGGIFIEEAVA